MAKRRVVVTGMGLVSPVGLSVDTAWPNVIAGNSGIGPITHFDAELFPTRIAGEVHGFEATDYIDPKTARKMDPFIHYGVAAATQAMEHSGLDINEANAARVGVMIGAGIGGLYGIEKAYGSYLKLGKPRRISPFFVPSAIINMIAGHVSIKYGLMGPNVAAVTACTTGTHNIGLAARTIAYGDADAMLAGGAEMSTVPTAIGGFCQAKAMSTRNDEPKKASRPWDKERDGFVLSDGAGVLVLEEYEHAKARGATIYAELSGFGMSGDAHHITAPPENGAGARLCMENALHDAGIAPEDIDYINAHGTSTPVGDKGETEAIKHCFGAAAKTVAVSSTKSTTGHLLGAAGAVEAIFSVQSLQDQVIAPTINLDNPDPECDLDYVPHTARDAKLNTVMSNSFGFGGTNGTLIFKRV